MPKSDLSKIIEVLSGVEPIASLSSDTIRKLAGNCCIENLETGTALFNAGETDNKSVYLVSGALLLTPEGRDKEDARTLEAKAQEAMYPVDDNQPHSISAVAAAPSEIIRIDIDLMDKLIAKDQLSVCQTSLKEDSAQDAKSGGCFFKKILDKLTGGMRPSREEIDTFEIVNKFRPPLFKTIAEDDMKAICARMEPISVKAGAAVIKQGDEGNYYYMIITGTAEVTRKVAEGSEPIMLAELGEGETFGEEALLSNAKRNATVTMKTKGTLLRLAKRDFIELLKEPMLKWLSPIEARDVIRQGGKWLDVRPASDFQRSHLGRAISIPLHELRNRTGELNQANMYICCCDTGRLSCSAAFLLGQRGYSVAVLRGGLQRISSN